MSEDRKTNEKKKSGSAPPILQLPALSEVFTEVYVPPTPHPSPLAPLPTLPNLIPPLPGRLNTRVGAAFPPSLRAFFSSTITFVPSVSRWLRDGPALKVLLLGGGGNASAALSARG
ncbi:unnamed protein product [Ophioblennius macclurei]